MSIPTANPAAATAPTSLRKLGVSGAAIPGRIANAAATMAAQEKSSAPRPMTLERAGQRALVELLPMRVSPLNEQWDHLVSVLERYGFLIVQDRRKQTVAQTPLDAIVADAQDIG